MARFDAGTPAGTIARNNVGKLFPMFSILTEKVLSNAGLRPSLCEYMVVIPKKRLGGKGEKFSDAVIYEMMS